MNNINLNKTVVPLKNNQPTVVPTNNTVVPQNGNNTIIAIILVMIIFIIAGVVGVTVLKSSKSNINVNNNSQNVALAEANEINKSKRIKSYKLDGVDVIIPDGYFYSESDGLLAIFNEDNSSYYYIKVSDGIFADYDIDQYKASLIDKGYDIESAVFATYDDYDCVDIIVNLDGKRYESFIFQVTETQIIDFFIPLIPGNDIIINSLKP